MTGRYSITLSDDLVSFELWIERNLTMITGNSGTGKTHFVRLVDYANRKPYLVQKKIVSEGVAEDVPLVHISDAVWWEKLCDTYHNSILVFDGADDFIVTDKEKFTDKVKNSDNYFIIISRYLFPELPYSMKDLYEFVPVEDNGGERSSRTCVRAVPISSK